VLTRDNDGREPGVSEFVAADDVDDDDIEKRFAVAAAADSGSDIADRGTCSR
jgi:hypothetical protein